MVLFHWFCWLFEQLFVWFQCSVRLLFGWLLMVKAVVLAAGEGSRLCPLTFTRPKCMIQLVGKPILEHVLLCLKDAGIREAVIVVKYMSEMVKQHFGDGKKLGMKLEWVEQGDEYGTGAAFLSASDFVDDTFLGIAGDVITEPSAIKRILYEHEGKITIGLTPVKEVSEYGIATLRNGRVVSFEEKPERSESNLANTSIYAFEPEALKQMGKLSASSRGEYEITDLLKYYIPKAQVGGVELSEYWLDMGMPWHLFDANEFLMGKEKPKKQGKVEDSVIKGKVIIEKGALVRCSYIEGPVYIGAGTNVGPHSYIRGCTSIGADCDIGDSTTVKNSIIFDHVNAKHLAYIGDSVVGSNCNFGAGTQIANYRFDAGPIKAEVKGRVMETMRTKLGAVIGDNTKTGVLSCIMPGRAIGDDCWIGAHVMINKNVERRTNVFLKQDLSYEKRI